MYKLGDSTAELHSKVTELLSQFRSSYDQFRSQSASYHESKKELADTFSQMNSAFLHTTLPDYSPFAPAQVDQMVDQFKRAQFFPPSADEKTEPKERQQKVPQTPMEKLDEDPLWAMKKANIEQNMAVAAMGAAVVHTAGDFIKWNVKNLFFCKHHSGCRIALDYAKETGKAALDVVGLKEPVKKVVQFLSTPSPALVQNLEEQFLVSPELAAKYDQDSKTVALSLIPVPPVMKMWGAVAGRTVKATVPAVTKPLKTAEKSPHFEKISKVETLIERGSTEGERQAAILAKERILKRQGQVPKEKESHATAEKTAHVAKITETATKHVATPSAALIIEGNASGLAPTAGKAAQVAKTSPKLTTAAFRTPASSISETSTFGVSAKPLTPFKITAPPAPLGSPEMVVSDIYNAVRQKQGLSMTQAVYRIEAERLVPELSGHEGPEQAAKAVIEKYHAPLSADASFHYLESDEFAMRIVDGERSYYLKGGPSVERIIDELMGFDFLQPLKLEIFELPTPIAVWQCDGEFFILLLEPPGYATRQTFEETLKKIGSLPVGSSERKVIVAEFQLACFDSGKGLRELQDKAVKPSRMLTEKEINGFVSSLEERIEDMHNTLCKIGINDFINWPYSTAVDSIIRDFRPSPGRVSFGVGLEDDIYASQFTCKNGKKPRVGLADAEYVTSSFEVTKEPLTPIDNEYYKMVYMFAKEGPSHGLLPGEVLAMQESIAAGYAMEGDVVQSAASRFFELYEIVYTIDFLAQKIALDIRKPFQKETLEILLGRLYTMLEKSEARSSSEPVTRHFERGVAEKAPVSDVLAGVPIIDRLPEGFPPDLRALNSQCQVYSCTLGPSGRKPLIHIPYVKTEESILAVIQKTTLSPRLNKMVGSRQLIPAAKSAFKYLPHIVSELVKFFKEMGVKNGYIAFYSGHRFPVHTALSAQSVKIARVGTFYAGVNKEPLTLIEIALETVVKQALSVPLHHPELVSTIMSIDTQGELRASGIDPMVRVSLENRTLKVTVPFIAKNVLAFMARLMEIAQANNAEMLQINWEFVNGRLYEVFVKRYGEPVKAKGLEHLLDRTEDVLDHAIEATFEIPVSKTTQLGY